jgi:hypothetical protein
MTPASDTRKRREIAFHPLPPDQQARALALLGGLDGLHVEPIGALTLAVEYHIAEYSLRELESLLLAHGFHLENTLLIRLKRSLAYYAERVQRENLDKPEPRAKQYPAHIESWARRPHGDHDDTPAEWRQYK